MAFPLRTRTRGRPGRNAGVTNVAAAPSFNPLTGWTTDPVHGVWASDPLWVPPADGGAVSSWRNGGSAYTSGAYIGADGLVLPGGANYATTPNSAGLNITGDLDIIVRATLTDWTPASEAAFVARGNLSSGTNTNYYFGVNNAGGGALKLIWGDGSSAVTVSSTVGNGITDGQPKWARVTLDVDNGAGGYEARFYLSDDGVSWTQLGATVTGGTTTTLFPAALPLNLGAAIDGTSRRLNGTIRRAIVKDGIDGTPVLDADFEAATPGISSFTESSSNAATVTVVSAQNPVQATGSKQPTYDAALAAFNNQAVVTFATDDVLAFDPANLAQPYFLVVVGATAGGSGVERLVGVGTDTGYGLGDDATPDWTFSAGTAIAGGAPDANPHLFRATTNGASSALLVDETSIVASNAGATGLTVLALGAGVSTLGTYANYLNGSIAYAAVFDTDPTALPEWATFKAWCLSFYGITVA